MPLGVTLDADGANVAVWSTTAEFVELCLFEGGHERRVVLPEVHGYVHHGHVPGVVAGTRYGFRAHGEFAPERGRWTNPHLLLTDPYARAITGSVHDHELLTAYDPTMPTRPNPRDSASNVPRSVVVDPSFDWGDDRPPRVPMSESVIYEAHVKGLTARHPDVPAELRGTYLGAAHPAVLDHLVDLGVTAIELLPVHHHVDDAFLVRRGLTNYWGYSTLGFFAPHGGYASSDTGAQVRELQAMVKAMHERGIEVILDVVYNHTAEGDHTGPTLCFRGLDNGYYHVLASDQRRYVDYTGCGNSVNAGNPWVLQMIMDSLRYWIEVMHVDGFRFDLASVLARTESRVDRLASFFDLVHQDPVVGRVKLIAEPWDVGADGYQVGSFPPRWAEWNGRYRDVVRDHWRGHSNLAEMATRLAGSADLYSDDGRTPFASVNFVTAHDGFTLADLVTYEHKRNEGNGEENRDGTDDNRSWGAGADGPTDDPAIIATRRRQQRNLIATLLLSQGVPMLLGGDELGRSQHGNNNAYCQDNEISWFDWEHVDVDLRAFTRHLIALRRTHPVLRRRRFLTGMAHNTTRLPDAAWFRPDGEAMAGEDWTTNWATAFAVFWNGDAITERDADGHVIADHSFYVCMNPSPIGLEFRIASAVDGHLWEVVVDTAGPDPVVPGHVVDPGMTTFVEAHSLVALRRPSEASA